uniref:Uncharacterized protein n=1 Tax=Lactuca sativa TaxID=4236 RepID=A0A9R1VR65_LACSA|nr:hypothetical protein LSAT_V11C400225540 [Lactuca sativa]
MEDKASYSSFRPSIFLATSPTTASSVVCRFVHLPVVSNVRGRCYVLTFDLSTHVFGRIALPKHCLTATPIQGSLAVISDYNCIRVRGDCSSLVDFNDASLYLMLFGVSNAFNC